MFQACETLERVERLNKVNYDFMLDSYLDHDAPVIITDAMESWLVMNTDNFYFENITQVSVKVINIIVYEMKLVSVVDELEYQLLREVNFPLL